jgi:hypothetical protein
LVYQIGVFNGVPDLASGGDDLSDAKDFAARVFVQPFKSGSFRPLGFGIAGSTGFERGSPTASGLPSYRTPGQQTLFRYNSSTTTPAGNVFANGKRTRISPQGYFYSGPLACWVNTSSRRMKSAGPMPPPSWSTRRGRRKARFSSRARRTAFVAQPQRSRST